VHAVINHIHKTQEWFEADAGRSKEVLGIDKLYSLGAKGHNI
jgi:hypothetical protein